MMNKNAKKVNPILWFLFAIVIPIIVVITLVVVILSLSGVNVIDWAKDAGKDIPVISSFIKTEKEIESEREQEQSAKAMAKQHIEIDNLTDQLAHAEQVIKELEQTISMLENSNEQAENKLKDNKIQETDTLKKLASSFKNMDPKQAALIVQGLESNVAISLFQELSNDIRGKILEAMEPDDAAKLTKLFINQK